MRRLTARLVAASALTTAVLSAQPQQSPPQFRGGISLVPVDVRVVDRQGNPVKDLTEADFTILEDGRPQPLRHYSTVDLGATGAVEPLAGPQANSLLTPSTRRVFLLVLGRGRLQPPAKGADAAITFVQKHVLPQDYVAVMAWGRATSFTTEHARTVALLERFRDAHEKVEQNLRHHYSGLAAVYDGPDLPTNIQAQVDAVFDDPTTTMTESARLTASGIRAELSIRNDMLTNELRSAVEATGFLSSVGEDADSVGNRLPLGMDDLTFDEFVGINRQSQQDLANLYSGIAYMRHLAGEKHLLFITERGTFLPSADDDRSIAAQAADARVAMHVMHTGGTAITGGGGFTPTSQRLSRMTGGQFSSTSRGVTFVDQLDRATRFQYLLGYTPTDTTLDGKFRRIEVRVNRPNVRVYYRQGYFARNTPVGLSPALILAQSRIASALMTGRRVPDIDVRVTASASSTEKDAPLSLEIIVKAGRVHLEPTPGGLKQKVTLEVAMFASDSRNQLIGQSWRTVTAEMNQEFLTRFQTAGLRLSGTLATTGRARSVKVVVYDPGSDLVGTAVVQVR
jgi:VWFA-related protein